MKVIVPFSALVCFLLAGPAIAIDSGSLPACRYPTSDAAKDNPFLTYAQQHRLFLNGAQEHVVFQSVSKHDGTQETVLPGFKADIGQVVPTSITLHRLPSDATSRVWAVKSCDYATLQNQLLIVNPQDRKVADIITQ